MFSKGDLIRCTTDGDIGVVLSTSTEIRKMYIYWFFDGFRRESMHPMQDDPMQDDLFEVISPTKEKQ